MLGPGDMEFIRRRLDDLQRHDSVTAFSGLYCEMIAERLVGGGPGAKALRRLFGLFLDWEAKYHSGLRNLTRGAGVNISSVGALGDRRHVGLQDLASRLEALHTSSSEAEGTRQLILAECRYQMVMYDRGVSCLEAALEAGVDHPIAHFALGYCRYVCAEQTYSAVDASTGEPIVVDARGYRGALLEAVSAFERGLSGGELDSQIYWWIGTCLERAGFSNAARNAFREARREETAAPWNTVIGNGVPDECAPWEDTDADLAVLRELLRLPYTAADIVGDEDV